MCELSCDEKVESDMDAQNRKRYGETILHILQYSTTQKRVVGNVAFATTLCNSKKNVKRRLINIMNTKKTRKNVTALALATVLVVAGGGVMVASALGATMPVYVSAATPSPEAPATTSASPNVETPATTARNLTVVKQEGSAEPSSTAIGMYEAAAIGADALARMFGANTNDATVTILYTPATTTEGAVMGASSQWQGRINDGADGYFWFRVHGQTGALLDVSTSKGFTTESRAGLEGEATQEQIDAAVQFARNAVEELGLSQPVGAYMRGTQNAWNAFDYANNVPLNVIHASTISVTVELEDGSTNIVEISGFMEGELTLLRWFSGF